MKTKVRINQENGASNCLRSSVAADGFLCSVCSFKSSWLVRVAESGPGTFSLMPDNNLFPGHVSSL